MTQEPALFLSDFNSLLVPIELPFAGGADSVKFISPGKHEHFVILTKSGECFGFGSNSEYRMGLAEDVIYPGLTLITLPEKIQQVACGYSATMFLSVTGKVYFTGKVGSRAETQIVQLSGIPTATRIALGRTVATILTNESSSNWYSFGSNDYYEQGSDSATDNIAPTRVLFHSLTDRAVDVVCGESLTILLTEHGELIGYGWNGYGQMGVKARERIPVTKLDIGFRVSNIFSAGSYTMALSTSNELYAAGWNDYGQCGVGTDKSIDKYTQVGKIEGKDVKQISLAFQCALIAHKNGKLYCAGQGFDNTPVLFEHPTLDAILQKQDILMVAGNEKNAMILVGKEHTSVFQRKTLTQIQSSYSVYVDAVIQFCW